MKSFVSKLTLICLFVSGLFITGCKQDLIEKSLDSVEYGSLVISNGDNANRALDFSAITQAEITISGYEMEDLSQTVGVKGGKGEFVFEKVPAGKNRIVTVKSNIDGVQMRAIVDIDAGQTKQVSVTWDTTALGNVFYYLNKEKVNISTVDVSKVQALIPDVHACKCRTDCKRY